MKSFQLFRLQFLQVLHWLAWFIFGVAILTLVIRGLWHLFLSSLGATSGGTVNMGNILIVPMALFGFVVALNVTPAWLRFAAQNGVVRRRLALVQLSVWGAAVAVLLLFNWLWVQSLGKPVRFVQELGYRGAMNASALVANGVFLFAVVGLGTLVGALAVGWYYYSNQLLFWGGVYAVVALLIGAGYRWLLHIAPANSDAAKLTRAIASGSFSHQLPAATATPWLLAGLAAALVVLLAVADYLLLAHIELSVGNHYLARVAGGLKTRPARLAFSAGMLVIGALVASAPVGVAPKALLVACGFGLAALPWAADRLWPAA